MGKVKVVRKKNTKSTKSKNEMNIEKELESIKWNSFKCIKVLEDGVCGLKKCCIKVEYKGEDYILKEFGKGLNWGRDYEFIDKLKYLFGLEDLGMKRIKSNMCLERIDKKIKSFVNNWFLKENEDTIYCMMKYKDNIGDLGKILIDDNIKKEMMLIRLYDGLFRSSDNILRNILVKSNKKGLISIDEGDIFGKRENIFNKRGDWCVKNINKDLVDECLIIIMKDKEEKIKIICNDMEKMGFMKYVNKFKDRFNNYQSIVYSELNIC